VKRLLAAVVAVVLSLAGCSTVTKPSGIRLSATLTGPTDVALRWSGVPRRATGLAVQFATGDGQFVVLGFEPPDTTSYRHRDLIPQTPFRYRILPYTGPASAPVEVTLPPGVTPDTAHRDDPDWAEPRKQPDPTAVGHPVTDSNGDAAPTGLTATVADPNGILFSWTDHASDEQGEMLEVRRGTAATAGWAVVAVLDPGVTSYGLVTLPDEKTASYRIRPFAWGTPSNVVSCTTGQE
jgi:hypothetical protein